MSALPIRISFFIKKKTSKDCFTIFARLTHQGKKTEISLKTDIQEKFWDSKRKFIRLNHPNFIEISTMLKQVEKSVLEFQQNAFLKGKKIDLQVIKWKLTNKNTEKEGMEPSFLEIFEKIISRKMKIGGVGNTKATIFKYKRCKNHLQHFLNLNFKQSDIFFDEIEGSFLFDFEVYLKTTGQCAHNTAMKHIQTLKTIFRQAFAEGLTYFDPFSAFKIRLQEVHREFLKEEELEKIISMKMTHPLSEKNRKLFLFSCFTGLSYIDLKNLMRKNIFFENNQLWIRTFRQKTNTRANIPLIDQALLLLSELNSDFLDLDSEKKLFKVSTNQKVNMSLKTIAKHAEINKRLTFHMARHTFATTVTLNFDIPIESVSKMLGHKNISTTQHYAKIMDKKLKNDMSKLNEIFSVPKNPNHGSFSSISECKK